MHTPTPLILLGWFARIKENPLIDKKFSSLKAKMIFQYTNNIKCVD